MQQCRSGLASLDGVPGAANSAFTFFTTDAAEQRLGDADTTNQILVRSDSMSPDELAGRVGPTVRDADVVTGADRVAERQDDLASAIGVFETILLVFGAIALFVGSFTIANTFTITVAQRTKELALVRAIGASRRQVLGSVVIEAAMIGLLAAVGGLAAGLGVARGLMWVFARFGLDFPDASLVIQTSTIVAAFAVGIGVTVAAAIVPARRAATGAPVDAMRDASIESTDISRKRLVIGVVLAAIGGYALIRGVTLVAGASMFASTASASVRGDAAEVLVADAVVRPIGSNPGLPVDVSALAASVDGVHAHPLHRRCHRSRGFDQRRDRHGRRRR